MRIYKRHPFSLPNSVKVNTLEAKCERIEKTIHDLQSVRDHLANGTMTEELYDFINMDESLENLMGRLPRPSNECACEALTSNQIAVIDEAIESLAKDWKAIVNSMWLAVKEWLLDWWDVNRFVKIDMQRLNAAYKTDPSLFGNIQSFGKITMRAYHKPYWEDMVDACEHLNRIISTLPQSGDLTGWIQTNLSSIQTCLKPFGHSVVTPGPRLIQGNAVHDKVLTSLDAARWRFNLLGQDMDRCIHCLSDEIQYRKTFNTLESLFATATINDKMNLHFVRHLVMTSKANSFVVTRGLRSVVRAAKGRNKLPAEQ